MKTLELQLKKELLIVDLEDNEATHINGYEFLCDGSELTEEIASEFAFDGFNISKNKKVYIDHYDECNCFESAVKSIISYVRIEGFYWLENPIKHPKDYEVFPDSLSMYAEQEKLHLEAEEKTFRNPLIFVKK